MLTKFCEKVFVWFRFVRLFALFYFFATKYYQIFLRALIIYKGSLSEQIIATFGVWFVYLISTSKM